MIVGIRRHLPVGHSQLNQWSPRPNLIIVAELHGPDATLAVTNNAILVDDFADVTVVGNLLILSVYLKAIRKQCGASEGSPHPDFLTPTLHCFHAFLLKLRYVGIDSKIVVARIPNVHRQAVIFYA
ncbi:MAG TPA: hypothetical protein EYQ30_11295 [Gammaproteobacteria bacterium]|nr:hypothetical protein [Gammaproteobacteria bacterium]